MIIYVGLWIAAFGYALLAIADRNREYAFRSVVSFTAALLIFVLFHPQPFH